MEVSPTYGIYCPTSQITISMQRQFEKHQNLYRDGNRTSPKEKPLPSARNWDHFDFGRERRYLIFFISISFRFRFISRFGWYLSFEAWSIAMVVCQKPRDKLTIRSLLSNKSRGPFEWALLFSRLFVYWQAEDPPRMCGARLFNNYTQNWCSLDLGSSNRNMPIHAGLPSSNLWTRQ